MSVRRSSRETPPCGIRSGSARPVGQTFELGGVGPGQEKLEIISNGFVARKPQNRRSGNSRKVMIWVSFKRFVL